MKVINFFGGPGVGKSTIASFIFSQLKASNKCNIELITEYAKDCVYEKKDTILKVDQLYVFAKQNHKLKMISEYSNDMDYVVTDSPLILSNIYGELNNCINDEFKNLVTSVFNSYENINFLIERSERFKYETYGRIQTNTEADEIHDKIKKYLDTHKIKYETLTIGRGFYGVMNDFSSSEQMKNEKINNN